MDRVALAMVLGFRESAADVYLFLLHRPRRRAVLFGAKLAVGAVVFLIVAAVPILLVACWAATPRTHASPFAWSMTLTAWQTWLSMPLLYLGSFLAGLRPARWLGTRIVPLAGAGTLLLMIHAVPGWWSIKVAVVVLLGSLLTANIVYVAENRDYP